MEVSFIGGGHLSTWRKPLTSLKSLINFITWCWIKYTLPWTGFQLTTLVVIGTDCIGSWKSNHHMITIASDRGGIQHRYGWMYCRSLFLNFLFSKYSHNLTLNTGFTTHSKKKATSTSLSVDIRAKWGKIWETFEKLACIITFLSPLPHVPLPTFHKTNMLHSDLKKDKINKFGIKYWLLSPA